MLNEESILLLDTSRKVGGGKAGVGECGGGFAGGGGCNEREVGRRRRQEMRVVVFFHFIFFLGFVGADMWALHVNFW